MKDLVGKGKPFHSSLDLGAKALKRKVGTGSEFLKELMALPGVKPTELKERGLEDLMNAPRMTHEEFLGHLANKPAPAVREKVLRNPTGDEVNAAVKEKINKIEAEDLKNQGYSSKEIKEELEGLVERIQKNSPFTYDQIWRNTYKDLNKNPTHHGEWTLPGGENYREMLIKAPKSMEQFQGVGAHFRGEPGILASMRLKDRTGPNGEKLLHLEELQSDWHQQGRERGYKGDYESQEEMIKKRDELYDARTALVKEALAIEKAGGLAPQELIDRIHGMNDQLRTIEERKDKARNAVPDAPFRKNWEEMALKRLIHHAAEKGYHGLVVTPGDVQADRYSLAKHIDSLSYEKKNDRYHLRYVPKGGGTFESLAAGIAPEDLASHVGKEMAEKIVKGEGNRAGSTGIYTFPNIDLQVGGEGMKGFYDKKVPNILNAIGKKHGVKVGKTSLKLTDMPDSEYEAYPEGHPYRQKNYPTVHHFPITEPMRQDILKNGLPLYNHGGVVHKAVGGAVQPSIAQMKLALSQNPASLQSIGVNEAPDMKPKAYIPPAHSESSMPAPGGVATPSGVPIGGIDMNAQQPGMQLAPQMAAQPQQTAQPPQGAQPQQPGQPQPGGMNGNILQMTPQGRALNALNPQQPQAMKKGGAAKSKAPTLYPPSRPLSDAEIAAHAERIVRQMHGLENPNERTLQQIRREATLPVDIRHHGEEKPMPEVDYGKLKGALLMGIPGDPSVGGILPSQGGLGPREASATLHGIGEREFESPVPLFGGYKYGAHGNEQGAWAGNISAARAIQNAVNKLAEEGHGDKIYGQYVKMTPQSLDYALHNLDALLTYQQTHKLPKETLERLTHLMRNEHTAGHEPMPAFPGFEDPAEVLLHAQMDSNLRKKLVHLLSTKKHVPTGKQDWEDVIHAISHPELRNLETGIGGSAIIEMKPHEHLKHSGHPTYSHDIPSELVGKSKYAVPHQIAYPRTHQYAKEEIQRMGKKVVPFNQMKMMGMREKIDEQYINQLGKYEQEMRKRLGYKKGGKVSDQTELDTMKLALTKKAK